MLSYCLKSKKILRVLFPRVSATSSGRTMILSKCPKCGSKKSKIYLKTRSKRIIK